MRTRISRLLAALLLSAISSQLSTCFAQGTAFTYQGRLNSGGGVANSTYDISFTVYDALTGGVTHAALTNAAVGVTNGLFTTTLDFGAIPDGNLAWFELAVRTNGGGTFTTLTPRQALTPAPYAMFANTASNLVGSVSSANLAGTYSSAVTLNNAGNSFTGNGSGLTGLNAWQTNGNSGTTAGANFIGTTDNQPLEFKVNGVRALRLEPNGGGIDAPNVIGGSSGNSIVAGNVGSTIGGGGMVASQNLITSSYGVIGGGTGNNIQNFSDGSTISGGQNNKIQSASGTSTIGGGILNTIQTSAGESTIGGGGGNMIQNSANDATIGGGLQNIITNGAESTIGGGANNKISDSYWNTIGGGLTNAIQNAGGATIGGGYQNTIQTNAFAAVISGGQNNVIQTNSGASAISGGGQNLIRNDSTEAVIGGGVHNQIQTNASYASIGGGYYNSILANATGATIGGGVNNTNSGYIATVPGGNYNFASGAYSFAAGNQAKAIHPGAFVWADSTVADFSSTAINQFAVRASGGVLLNLGTNNLEIASGGLKVTGAGVNTGTAAFTQRAVGTNTSGNITTIYNPICDNNPSAILIVTHNYSADTNSTSQYNLKQVGVYYAPPHWTIYNEDSSPMALGRAFNVLIVKP